MTTPPSDASLPIQHSEQSTVPGSPQKGMFGVTGTGDTSGFGGLVRGQPVIPETSRPYGGYFDEVADALEAGLREIGVQCGDAVYRVVVDRGEITFYVHRDHIATVCQVSRDDPALRFETCSSLSGTDYLHANPQDPDRLHVSYHLLSMTYRRRIRLEVAVTTEDPHVPSVTQIYPTVDWHERETYDMFGIIFVGHPALTRILMPDDWDGFPQRKDYPLGGVPVEYKGADIPPPDERRAYK